MEGILHLPKNARRSFPAVFTAALAAIILCYGASSMSSVQRYQLVIGEWFDSSRLLHPTHQLGWQRWGAFPENPGTGPQTPLSCNIFEGRWVNASPQHLPYTHDTCPYISPFQNCQGNGRPDTKYQFYLWRPHDCQMPPAASKDFLHTLRHRTLAFVGDSLARNHFEALVCLLAQAERPIESINNATMVKYIFTHHNATILRIHDTFLVRHEDPLDMPGGSPLSRSVRLFLDELGNWVEQLHELDILVINVGHWWMRPCALIFNNTLVGVTDTWRRSKRNDATALEGLAMSHYEAYELSLQTVLRTITQHPLYRGLTIFRTLSVSHYFGGKWNTGGTCALFKQPLEEKQIVDDPGMMRLVDIQKRQVMEAVKNNMGSSRLTLMDVMPMARSRADGHPGIYRSFNKTLDEEQGGKKKKANRSDCLHWCIPGPIDVWNDFLLEIIKRDHHEL